jgi:hypothetical protein
VINDEGWICGSKSELLMWTPSEHRGCLQPIWISGKRGTILNLSNFVLDAVGVLASILRYQYYNNIVVNLRAVNIILITVSGICSTKSS